ncbi:MAG: hypothetical protein RIC35_03430 [Marinoscillum sp.]
MDKLPITNSHVHIFTRDHVPPFIAKTFVFWPFYYLLHLGAITWMVKVWYKFRNGQLYNAKSTYNQIKDFYRKAASVGLLKLLFGAFTALLFVNVVLICFNWLASFGVDGNIKKKVDETIEFLDGYYMFIAHGALQILAVVFVVLVFPDLRRLLLTILKIPFKFLSFIPGKMVSHLLERYMLLGKFALHKDQGGIYTKLNRQYPDATKFIVLPMDMEQMGAGKVKKDYNAQLDELIAIKSKDKQNVFKPFVFVDPRRIKVSTDFFSWSQGKPGEVVPDPNCRIFDCIVNHHFSGFKIYPALGYYPFDEALLPLWKYAADNQLPIMTHTIRGTIYYRGKKQENWFHHPVFKQSKGDGEVKSLELNEKKNIDFTVNFTHPMNYLCLLSEPLLRILVGKSSTSIQQLFGYNGAGQPMDFDLSHLKVCLAHHGGEEEWVKYLEKDRYYYAQQLIQHRHRGLEFFSGNDLTSTDWNRLYNYWSYVDWYSIISSLMLQYENVYSDISYILSKPRILPLLNETLDEHLNPALRKKVLYGTDFYVVRNHFSEKDLLAQMRCGLREADFDQIARENPKDYLSNNIAGHEGY